uniref:Secreted protein n=1 Tax=Ascaris lumbricoides TaxID=6252 RepID=A0A0M3HXJ5_ASCLU
MMVCGLIMAHHRCNWDATVGSGIISGGSAVANEVITRRRIPSTVNINETNVMHGCDRDDGLIIWLIPFDCVDVVLLSCGYRPWDSWMGGGRFAG